MFTSLWLNGLISSYNKKNQIHASDSGQHVFDEPFVAGDVYKTEACLRRKVKVREPQVDRNATLLFFFQTIGVNAR